MLSEHVASARFSWAHLLPAALLILSWEWLAWRFPESRFFFSEPGAVLMALWSGVASGELLRHTAVTGFEALLGFAIGTTCGAVIGLSFWYWAPVGRMARPYIVAAGAVPVFAIAPMVIVWFGIGIFAKVMVAVLSTLFVAITQAYQGATNVDPRYLRLMAVLGGTRKQSFIKVVAPSALQWVLNSMRLNVGLALAGAFVGEFISSQQGLGWYILRAASLFDVSRVLAGCVVLATLALVLNAGVDALERTLTRRRSA